MPLKDSENLVLKRKAQQLREHLRNSDLVSIYRELSAELEITDFSTLTLHELYFQAILARVLTISGCHKTALKMIGKVKIELDNRFLEKTSLVLYIYSMGSSVLFHAYQFSEALEWIHLDQEETFEDDLFGSHQMRHALYKGFIEKQLNKETENLFLNAYHSPTVDVSSKCTFLIQELNLWSFYHDDLSNEEFQKKVELLKQWDMPSYLHKYHLFKARIYLGNKNIPMALKEILKAQQLCPPMDLNSYVEILFFKSIISKEGLNFKEQVLLACGMTYSPFSYLYGNRYKSALDLKNGILKKYYKDSDENFDCWIIINNSIRPALYSDITFNDNFLDLTSGAFKNNGVLSWLSRNRTNGLMAIISGAEMGVPEELIAEKVYEDDLSLFHSVRWRLRDLVTQLINTGFSIKRQQRLYKFTFEDHSFPIIFPRDHHFKDKLYYLKKHTQVINNELVCEILSVKHRTATEFLRQWKLEHKIMPCLSGKYGDYEIVT